MHSEEIRTIYKKLVQSYVNSYPHGNPLRMLNKHIEVYTQDQWNNKEQAILDLALREGIEIPKVKELIERGKTRKEAILEVSKNTKFQVSEREAEKWLKETQVGAFYEELLRYYFSRHTNPKEILYYRINELVRQGKTRDEAIRALYEEEKPGEAIARKKTEEAIEKQVSDHERSLERLTILFSKGEINEESYKLAVKTIEKEMEELRGGKGFSVTKEKQEPIRERKPYPPAYSHRKPTVLWYLVPFFFGIVGGIIGYVGVKDDNEEMAKALLFFGFFWTLLVVFLLWYILARAGIPLF